MTSSRRPGSEITWPRQVLDAFKAADGGSARLSTGEFVDRPVARRAQLILELAASLAKRGSSEEA